MNFIRFSDLFVLHLLMRQLDGSIVIQAPKAVSQNSKNLIFHRIIALSDGGRVARALLWEAA